MSSPPFARPELTKLSRLTVPDAGRSHPFPVSQLPDLLESRFYFVEHFRERDFLRMLSNPYFIREVNFADLAVEVPGVGPSPESIDITLMWVQFTPDPMTVGYSFRDQVRWFVPWIDVGASIGDLDEEVQRFYDCVNWEHRDGVRRGMEMSAAFTLSGV